MPCLVDIPQGPVLSEGSQKRSGSVGEGWWSGGGGELGRQRAGKLQSECMIGRRIRKEGGRRRTEALHTVNLHFHS